MTRTIVIPAIIVAVFICAGTLHPLSAEAPGLPASMALEAEQTQPCNDLHQGEYDGDPLDLQGCQQYCGSIFGVELYRGGGGGSWGSGIAYATCIQDCNRKYWKAWDKEVKGEGKKSNGKKGD